MQGWQVHELGDPADVLTWGEIDDPRPGPGQVLVRVHAAGATSPTSCCARAATRRSRPCR